jgi:pimeloyl-ACP methyl ester carboxylesterase
MPNVDLPGVHLWYTDTGGDGPPVVFFHAASGTCESWVYQLPAFTQAGYRCIAFDRKGWGRSRPDLSGEQPGHVSDDLHRLADHLALGRLHLVATAAGGGGSMDYALSHPERVRSLVIADHGFGQLQDAEYRQMTERIRPPVINALPVELRELGPGYRATNPDGVRRWLEIERASATEGERGPRQQARNQLTFAVLETLRVPTLLLAGDADLITPAAQMRVAAAHIAGCQFATVPEAGHAAFWERPDVWNRIVLDFIAQH